LTLEHRASELVDLRKSGKQQANREALEVIKPGSRSSTSLIVPHIRAPRPAASTPSIVACARSSALWDWLAGAWVETIDANHPYGRPLSYFTNE
jgi:hypothetical protein